MNHKSRAIAYAINEADYAVEVFEALDILHSQNLATMKVMIEHILAQRKAKTEELN